jgi:hypothetical protein
MAKSSRPAKTTKDKSTVRNSRTTVSGPAEPDPSGPGDILAEQADAFVAAIDQGPRHRHFARETDPPRV